MLRLSPASMAPPPHYRPRISYIHQGRENSWIGGGWESSPGWIQSTQTKWLVLRMIHGSRIPGSTWTDFLGKFYLVNSWIGASRVNGQSHWAIRKITNSSTVSTFGLNGCVWTIYIHLLTYPWVSQNYQNLQHLKWRLYVRLLVVGCPGMGKKATGCQKLELSIVFPPSFLLGRGGFFLFVSERKGCR